MMQNDCPLDKNWEQTSDSIAAWIASYLNISNLLLVKSSEQVIQQTDLNELAQNGCIDPNLPNFITENNQNIQLLHKSQIKQFEDMLQR